MAVLNNADFTAYKRHLRGSATARAEIRAANLSRSQLQDAFQALEDGYNSRRVAIKGEVDTAAGTTLTNALAVEIEDAWMKRRAGAI